MDEKVFTGTVGTSPLTRGAAMTQQEYHIAKEKAADCRRIIREIESTPLIGRAASMRKSEQCGIRSYLAELDASIDSYEKHNYRPWWAFLWEWV